MESSVYVVAFVKILPPKKELTGSFNKPSIELSMVQKNHPQTKINEIKILIQELFIKLDQCILNALISFFMNTNETTDSKTTQQ